MSAACCATLVKVFDITRRQLGTLLWMYLRISLVAWITLLVAFLIWTKLPPTAIWATFILLELVMLVQLGARLWQMASATVWYQRHAEAGPAAPSISRRRSRKKCPSPSRS